MAFPYTHSPGPLLKAVSHLRNSFPPQVTAETLKKLGVAPNNESYVINVLRFLGVIDEEGKKVSSKTVAFVQHKDEAFATEFEKLVKAAYADLFELHGDNAWELDAASLTQFFRTTDESSAVVGSRQATTFRALAALAGHSELPTRREAKAKPQAKPKTGSSKPKDKPKNESAVPTPATPQVGFSVRIEVNLPAGGDQQTYDLIFRSIRENLIDGHKS